jgi:quercetin dioxygenase-like cupin family protein
MRYRVAFVIVALLLTVGMAPTVAADPPLNTTRHMFRTDGLPVSGPMEMVKYVNDYAPGAATPPQTHPGLLVATVLEGSLIVSHGGTEKVYGVGDSFTEMPNEVGMERNATAGRTRVMVSVVVPKGAPPATPEPGGPSPAAALPTTLYLFRTDAAIPTGGYDVAHAVFDFVPGAQSLAHTHPGQAFVMVLVGGITFREGGTEKVYGVGESYVETPGVVGQVFNTAGTMTTLVTTLLLPRGAALSTPVAVPAAIIRRLGDG